MSKTWCQIIANEIMGWQSLKSIAAGYKVRLALGSLENIVDAAVEDGLLTKADGVVLTALINIQ